MRRSQSEAETKNQYSLRHPNTQSPTYFSQTTNKIGKPATACGATTLSRRQNSSRESRFGGNGDFWPAVLFADANIVHNRATLVRSSHARISVSSCVCSPSLSPLPFRKEDRSRPPNEVAEATLWLSTGTGTEGATSNATRPEKTCRVKCLINHIEWVNDLIFFLCAFIWLHGMGQWLYFFLRAFIWLHRHFFPFSMSHHVVNWLHGHFHHEVVNVVM